MVSFMKFILDFFPILLFFGAYKMADIYTATAVLMAATNSSGGCFAKMISPQNIATGVAISGLQGQESSIFRRTFIHSLVFTAMLSVLVWLQQFVFPWMIPPH